MNNPKTKKAITGHDFSKLERWKVIELLAYWEGGFNSTHLRKIFHISREHASRDVKSYLSQNAENIVYDASTKLFIPSESFTPKIIQGNLGEYLSLLRKYKNNYEKTVIDGKCIDIGAEPTVHLEPKIIRSILLAIRSQQKIKIQYRSWNNPDGKIKFIHPHAIAYSGLRWHCRAYDDEYNQFRDYHLSRFINEAETLGKSNINPEEDKHWNTIINVILAPNQALSTGEQKLVEKDYNMKKSKLILKSRRCMVQYLLQSYQVDVLYISEKETRSPRYQPLTLLNYNELEPYLFTMN